MYVTVPDAQERAALVALYNATGGGSWTNKTNWLQGSTSADFATWYGVTVENGDVVSVDLRQNNLDGGLPPELGNLSALEYLNLSSNRLASVPDQIGSLKQLVVLYLNSNNLTSLPDGFGGLTELGYLNLSYNNIATLPASIGNLSKLGSLYMYLNQLTTLPSTIGGMSRLETIFLFGNPLTSLPPEIGDLPRLRGLFPKQTQLTTLPPEINQCTNLEFLNVADSRLDSLPPMDNLPKLRGVIFSNNDLRTIPDFSNHPNKANLSYQVQDNRLDLNYIAQHLGGVDQPVLKSFLYRPQSTSTVAVPIPGPTLSPFPDHPQSNYQWQEQVNGTWQDIAGATEATYTVSSIVAGETYRVQVTNNWLPNMSQSTVIQPVEGGVLPAAPEYDALVALYNATSGNQWQNKTNWLQGNTIDSIATWYGVTVDNGRVVAIDLRQNKLNGSLPPEIGQLTDLEYLNVGINTLGNPPAELGSLPNLAVLYLDQTQITSLPPEIGNLGSLEYINLNQNQLTALPPAIGNLSQLKSLWLMQNQLTGLPPEIGNLGNLGNLENLYLYQNPLASLPSTIGQLSKLTGLFPKATQLTTLPPEMTQLTELEWLNIESSRLDSIPDLSGLPNLKGIIFHNNFLEEIADFSNHPNEANLLVGIRNNYVDLNQVARNLTGPDAYELSLYDYGGQNSPTDTVVIADATGGVTLSPYDYLHPQSQFQWQSQPVAGSTTWEDVVGATEASYTATSQGTETLYRVRLTNAWIAGQEQYSVMYQVPSDYVAPAPPSIVSNPPDGTTAPGIGGPAPASRTFANVNYVRSFTPRTEISSVGSVTMSQSVANVSVSTQYTDGQGRPVQTVVRGAGGSASQDLVQPVEYDELGRATQQYLPYAASSATGAYRSNALAEQYNFYTSGPGDVARSDYAYAEVRYEDSPLGRVVRQGNPGQTYRVDGQHAVTQQYRSNTGGDAVRRWTVSESTPGGTTLSTPGTYGAGTLYVTVLTDENGNDVTEFTNRRGLTVLKRVQGPDGNMDTYYAYDLYDQLRYTIPPEATQRLSGNWSQAGSTTFQQQWLFGYQYDEWGNMIIEEVPGGGTTYYVYDAWDRPVLSQSATMRAQNASQWAYTKYDYLDRPVLTGTYTPGSDRASLQTAARNTTVRAMSTSSGEVGYSLSQGFPSVSEASVRQVSYYDNYSFPHASQTAYGAGGTSHRSAVKGLMTGSMSRKLDDNSWLKDVTYYDEQYRPIVMASDNHQGGTDRLTTSYRNAVNDEVLSTTLTHNGTESHTITQGYTYDHVGRLTQETHQLDQGATMTLSTHAYNALGQRVQKQMNSGQQTVDYRYHIRGWLTKINELDNSEDFFAQSLYYDYGFTQKQYNGNLSGIQWNRAGGAVHAYGYVYDEADRLEGADYRLKPAGGSWAASPGNYTVDQVSYDQNGNIQRLKRYGQLQELQYALDDLDYDYTGNRLTAVNELGDGQAELGFRDAGSGSGEYAYDAGGNLTQDQNKGITNITYDALLQLPLVVSMSTGTIRYTYDAAGNRLTQRTEDENGVLLSTTDYLGAFEYRNGELSLVHHSEGRVSFAQGTGGNYHFDLRDHLGNVRVTFSDQPVTTTATASMEASAAPSEEALFMGVAESRHTMAFHNTTDASATESDPNQVALLLPGQQGPAKSLLVHAGDEVHLEVNARYETSPNQVQGLEGVATEIAGAAARSATGLEGVSASGGLNPATTSGGLVTGSPEEVPKAYLNYLVYDEDYQLVDQGFVKVSKAAAVGKANPKAEAETLALDVAIEQDGYLLTYLSHEAGSSAAAASGSASNSRMTASSMSPASASGTPVYFDDFTVEQQSYIVAVNDYYPFGGRYDQEGSIGVENKYGYQYKELQTELGLDLLDFHARQYDPLLGRFHSYDPQSQFASGYVGMGNMPTVMVDPDGEFAFLIPVFYAAYVSGHMTADNGGNYWEGFAKGAVTSLIGAGVGGAVSGVVSSALSTGFSTGTSFVSGLAGGVAGGLASGLAGAGFDGSLEVGNLLSGAAISGVTGGVLGGFAAQAQGGKFFSGNLDFGDAIVLPDITVKAARLGNFGSKWGDTNYWLHGRDETLAAIHQATRFWNFLEGPGTKTVELSGGLKVEVPSYVGGAAPAPGVRGISVPQQAQSLAQRLGKNSVTIKTVSGHTRYDLAGRAHGPVATPHKLDYIKNYKPDGTLGNIGKASKLPTPMNWRDLRTVIKFLGL